MINRYMKALLLVGVVSLACAELRAYKYTKNFCTASTCKSCKKARKEEEKRSDESTNMQIATAEDNTRNRALYPTSGAVGDVKAHQK